MKYDLHIHTMYSRCSNLKPEVLLKFAKKFNLNGIAVTDHYTIKGALAVSKLNKDKNFEVIVGSEIDTSQGSILAYYINKEIKSRTIPEILDEIRSQGGLAAIAHPFRFSISKRHFFSYPIKEIKNKIDAIETFNARNFFISNKKALKLSEEFNVAKIAGSDAHFPFEFGNAYTLFDGSLKKALKQKKTQSRGKTTFGPLGGLMSFLRYKFNP